MTHTEWLEAQNTILRNENAELQGIRKTIGTAYDKVRESYTAQQADNANLTAKLNLANAANEVLRANIEELETKNARLLSGGQHQVKLWQNFSDTCIALTNERDVLRAAYNALHARLCTIREAVSED